MTIRAVLDSNVFVSAQSTAGASHRIVQAWLERRAFELVFSEGLLLEFDDVLRRPRLAKLIRQRMRPPLRVDPHARRPRG